MLVKVKFHAENILDLFNMKDEKKALNNGLRALEQSFMDLVNGELNTKTSNISKSVADKPKSLNSQKIRQILKKGIDLCPG